MLRSGPRLLLVGAAAIISAVNVAEAAYPDVDMAAFTSGTKGFRVAGGVDHELCDWYW